MGRVCKWIVASSGALLVAALFIAGRHRPTPLVIGEISSSELSEITSACHRLESRARVRVVTLGDIPDYLNQWFADKRGRLESVEVLSTNRFRVSVGRLGAVRCRYLVWFKDSQWNAAILPPPSNGAR